MCYKTVLTKPLRSIIAYKNTPLNDEDSYETSFHIDGFKHPQIFIIPQDSAKRFYSATWGLIPEIEKGDPAEFYKQGKYNTLNARDDKVFKSPSYRKPILEGRCLIFADGFFEPHEYLKKKQPYFCYIPGGNSIEDRELFTFAGIYTTIGEGRYFVSLITVPANPFFAEVHNSKLRMPLVLDKSVEDDWLEENQTPNVIKDIMKEGFTSKRFDAYPVSNLIYSKSQGVKTNTADILKPVDSIEPPRLF